MDLCKLFGRFFEDVIFEIYIRWYIVFVLVVFVEEIFLIVFFKKKCKIVKKFNVVNFYDFINVIYVLIDNGVGLLVFFLINWNGWVSLIY